MYLPLATGSYVTATMPYSYCRQRLSAFQVYLAVSAHVALSGGHSMNLRVFLWISDFLQRQQGIIVGMGVWRTSKLAAKETIQVFLPLSQDVRFTRW